MSEGTFRVLVVCTGNICRSPYAERLLRSALARIAAATGDARWTTDVLVTSAGTLAMVGRPIEPPMAALLDRGGVAGAVLVDPHAARQLERDLVADADLVLGLAREHRREVVMVLPSASRRVFALNEFARLLDDAVASGVLAGTAREAASGAPAAVLEAVVDAAAMRRGFALPPDDPGADDVLDPYHRGDGAYAASAAHMIDLVQRIERGVLAGVAAGSAGASAAGAPR
ncbi:MAG: low molecular weight phosphatase family protein [Microbacteriaceae bacterium]|nr:low molecular weight phosphatase family protein [Microbacteriaceae bacterium]